MPESFKVLLKELQSLGLDIKVLREDNTEVEIMESVDYTDSDYRYEIEGDTSGRDYKQKTAYEMSLCDWSSDVCSSDLCPWIVVQSRRFFAARLGCDV